MVLIKSDLKVTSGIIYETQKGILQTYHLKVIYDLLTAMSHYNYYTGCKKFSDNLYIFIMTFKIVFLITTHWSILVAPVH